MSKLNVHQARQQITEAATLSGVTLPEATLTALAGQLLTGQLQPAALLSAIQAAHDAAQLSATSGKLTLRRCREGHVAALFVPTRPPGTCEDPAPTVGALLIAGQDPVTFQMTLLLEGPLLGEELLTLSREVTLNPDWQPLAPASAGHGPTEPVTLYGLSADTPPLVLHVPSSGPAHDRHEQALLGAQTHLGELLRRVLPAFAASSVPPAQREAQLLRAVHQAHGAPA